MSKDRMSKDRMSKDRMSKDRSNEDMTKDLNWKDDAELLLEAIVQWLVPDPDSVWIERVDTSSMMILTIHVPAPDVAKIIGRSGSIIESIKVIFRAISGKYQHGILLEISDPMGADRGS